MDIDPDIANWVLEFLIRQPLEDRTLNSVLRALPLPNGNPNLQKSLLLKKLESEVSPVSEITLDLLEELEEIEFRRGNSAVSDVMKRAYCAAAVECTLKLLIPGNDGDGDRKFRFFEMVKSVWRGRIGRMEKDVDRGGLGSELLWAWKDDIEAAVWDDSVCESLRKKFEGVRADVAVRVYVSEEREKMGPSFLEVVAERVKSGDEGLQKIMGVNDGIEERVAGEETPSCPAGEETQTPSCPVGEETPSCAVDGSNAGKEMQKRKIKLRDKLVGVRRLRGTTSVRGAKIVDYEEITAEPSSLGSYSLPRSAEVNKAREALASSSLELRAAVKDPLPEALRAAEAIQTRQNNRNKSGEDNTGGPKLFTVDADGVVQSIGANMNNVPKPSLMQRNSSARTYEWDESVDGSPEGIACRALQLPTPKRINTSPLKLYENNNLMKRRKTRKWSEEEEAALRAGVEEFGKGSWKAIRDKYRDTFENRTEVDLKDKWRNLMRY